MLLIFTPQILPEIEYILETLFQEFLGLEIRISTDEEEAKNHSGPVFHYTPNLNENAFGIQKSNYFESFNSEIFNEYSLIENKLNPIEDWIALSYFLIARVEEYHSKDLDSFNRYKPENSFLFKKQWLQIPVIDLFVQQLKKGLELKFNLKTKSQDFQVQLSFDVDTIYEYQHHPMLKKWAKWLFHSIKNPSKSLYVLKNLIQGKDPLDTFKAIKYLSGVYNTKVFFLCSTLSPYDDSQLSRAYCNSIDLGKAEAGIHPSFHSLDQLELIEKDIHSFESLFGFKPSISRQHFLRMQIPNTYKTLIKYNIKADYTMGYASEIGFRAGTSKTFYWFDAEKKKKTSLRIHPFFVMDQTVLKYHKTQKASALKAMEECYHQIQKVNGTACFLLHNNTLAKNSYYQPLIHTLNQILGADFKNYEKHL
jgi:hypothetical protein